MKQFILMVTVMVAGLAVGSKAFAGEPCPYSKGLFGNQAKIQGKVAADLNPSKPVTAPTARTGADR
jgi:hypothetical protein